MRAPASTVLGVLLTVTGLAFADGDTSLGILTYPVGVVSGKVLVKVALGPSGAPADLFLDGTEVCSPTAAAPQCTVDLGADPRVHLLEFVRRDAQGRVTARASRWVNRPGEEAELFLRLDPRTEQGACHGHTLWFHPLKEQPVALQVLEDGRPLRLLDAHGSFGFPCPDPAVPHVVSASAVFPDGRRAEAVTLSGGFGGEEASELTSVALEVDAPAGDPCTSVAAGLAGTGARVEASGFEVVFVLDPGAAYAALASSGGAAEGVASRRWMLRPGGSWKRAEASLIGADKLWFVAPDDDLHRVNGFSEGTMHWLELLFGFGEQRMKNEPRLADAVAASGLVAAAGPRRRAVVLLLGNRADRDASHYSAHQARTYLAEVGVPLFVFRNARRRDDGWPEGVPVHNMEGMREALEAVRARLDQQCIAWLPGELDPRAVDALLPAGLHVAGRSGQPAVSPGGARVAETPTPAR